jgi:hypothetical protein
MWRRRPGQALSRRQVPRAVGRAASSDGAKAAAQRLGQQGRLVMVGGAVPDCIWRSRGGARETLATNLVTSPNVLPTAGDEVIAIA